MGDEAQVDEVQKRMDDEAQKRKDLVEAVIAWLQFDNERIHRERHPEPGDSLRLSELVARLRAAGA